MKKRIDFDIEKAKSGEYKVITKSGFPVRILCWDRKESDYPIVALVEDKDGYETIKGYTIDGKRDIETPRVDEDYLCLEIEVEPNELLTDFEYKVGDSMYGSYIDEMNEEGLAAVRATARELLDLAKMELFNEAWFDSHNAREIDVLRNNVSECRISDNLKKVLSERGWDIIDVKNYLATLKDLLIVCTRGEWQDSDKSGVSNIRYSVQGGVIYDCVGGKEISERDMIDLVLRALNYRESEDEEVLKRKRERVERVGRIRKSLTTHKLNGRTSNDVGL